MGKCKEVCSNKCNKQQQRRYTYLERVVGQEFHALHAEVVKQAGHTPVGAKLVAEPQLVVRVHLYSQQRE